MHLWHRTHCLFLREYLTILVQWHALRCLTAPTVPVSAPRSPSPTPPQACSSGLTPKDQISHCLYHAYGALVLSLTHPSLGPFLQQALVLIPHVLSCPWTPGHSPGPLLWPIYQLWKEGQGGDWWGQKGTPSPSNTGPWSSARVQQPKPDLSRSLWLWAFTPKLFLWRMFKGTEKLEE